MKLKTFVTGAAVLAAVLSVVSCNTTGDGPSSPSSPPVVATQATTAPAAVVGTPQEVKAPDVVDGSIVNIDAQGNVTLYAPREWSACVYTYTDFQKQTFSHGFAVREGFNAFQLGPICGQTYVQVDVQAGLIESCPVDPWAGPFQGFKKGRANILVTAAKPCNTCVEKETKTEVVTYGEWGVCTSSTTADGACAKTRVATTTTTTTYAECQNKPPLVVVTTKNEYEKCECPVICTPSEVVTEVVVKGEWSECKVAPAGADVKECRKERTDTITTTTTYAVCENKKPKVVVTTKVVYEACECVCVESETPKITYGTAVWDPKVLEGQCNPEVLPGVNRSTTQPLNCRQIGTQPYTTDFLCKADGSGTQNLCKNVACLETCANTLAYYKTGANAGLFNLANSGDAKELEWVSTYVGVGPWQFVDKDEYSSSGKCKTAEVAAKVVIVKAGSGNSISGNSIAYEYRTYLNVTQGQEICSYNKDKDISHISYFNCK